MLPPDASPVAVQAPLCEAATIAALTASAPSDAPPYRLVCRAVLPAGASVTRRILLEGAESSGAGVDCRGGTIGPAGRLSSTDAPTVAIWSRRDGAGWSAPTDVRIVNCTIHGNVRIWGMGAGGDLDTLRRSSRTAGHTTALQAAAPTGVRLTNVTVVGTGSIPLYVGPGVTRVTVSGGAFRGRSVSTAVYLDAESAGAVIEGVDFDVVTAREQIAVDGSADNRITDNRFNLRWRGGVFLYRNCGEDGVIRHQTPSRNVIQDNDFRNAAWFRPREVVVGAREGNRRYCSDDAGWPFGSSVDDSDRAADNRVDANRVRYRWFPAF